MSKIDMKPKRMTRATATALALSAATCMFGATRVHADDVAARDQAVQACAACHGPGGNKPVTPDTPRLAGQEYGYLVQALNDYRSGARNNPVMGAMAKPLTDKQIRDHASYFSEQQGLTTKR